MSIMSPCKDCRKHTPERHYPGCQDPGRCDAFAEYRSRLDLVNIERTKETSARWTAASRARRVKWIKDGHKL